MNERVRRQEVEATEFDDELSDEALDRQDAALSTNSFLCGRGHLAAPQLHRLDR
jgi:hypothetical protein